MTEPHGLTPEGMEIRASDRTYISDSHGSWRVSHYQQNGVRNSDIFMPNPVIAQDHDKALKKAFQQVMKQAEAKANEMPSVPIEAEVSQPEAVAETQEGNLEDA